MKKMMMILAVLFVMVGSSFGGNSAKNVYITQIQTESGYVRVDFTGGTFTPDNGLPIFSTVFQDNTVEGQRKLAILLSALQSQNPVDLWTTDDISFLGIDSKKYNRLNAVYIRRK